MKTNKELLSIYDNQNSSSRAFWKYQQLTSEERLRLFDLLARRNPMEVSA